MEEKLSPLIIRLEIDENDLESGVNCVSLVSEPAIEEDFYLFSKQELKSYTDYPQSVSNNAKRGIELNEKVGNKCATQTGKVRAQQLANREPISEETIKRMYSYLSRAEEYYDEGDTKACGTISYLLWGGKSAKRWAESKLKQIERDKEKFGIDVADLPNYINEASMSLSELEGVPIFDNSEEAIIYSLIIGCEGEIHTHETQDGTVFYMPCVTMEQAQGLIEIIQELKEEPKYWSDFTPEEQDEIYDALMEVGEDEEKLLKDGWIEVSESVEFANRKVGPFPSTPDDPSFEDVGKERLYRYKYQVRPGKGAPIQNNSRDFCIRLINANKLYRKEDINEMTINNANPGFAQKGALVYDIFKYVGGKNCRHEWVKKVYKKAEVKGLPESWQTKDDSDSILDILGISVPAFFQKDLKEKQIVAGPLMVPDKMIYRYDEMTGEYWVYFSKDTIEKIAHKFLIQKHQHNSNLEHSEYLPLENVSLVESWIIEDGEKDKAYSMTGKVYPKGTWFGLMKINDKTVWNEWVKTGMVKGFSVEGYFADQIINASNQKFYYRTTKGGTEIVIDHKTNVVFILEDGERKVVMPDGSYELTNGKTLVVKGGKAIKGSFSS